MHVSIIICTRDRAESLRKTLQSFHALDIPVDWGVELLLMDDGSQDHTSDVVRSAKLERIAVRYFAEPRAGKCPALNRALAEARGKVLLFTDDDVCVPCNWVTSMVTPLLADQTDAIAGSVQLNPALRCDWMDATLDEWFAAGTPARGDLWGVNMGIHRRVLDAVPGFDCDLGPGALGYAEDTLFALLINRAGFRMSIGVAEVAHFPDVSRIREENLLRAARGRGASAAYIDHHLMGKNLQIPKLQLAFYRLKKRIRLAISTPGQQPRIWLLFYTFYIHYLEKIIELRFMPRRYLGSKPD